MIGHIDNEALCFALVRRNLGNFNVRQDGDDNGSRICVGFVASISFLQGFPRTATKRCGANRFHAFFVFIHMNRGLPLMTKQIN